MARNRKSSGFTAIRIEGGILPPEFLAVIAGSQAKHQAGGDYGLTRSLSLKDELARYWRIANDLYTAYAERRDRADANRLKVGVHDWLLPLLKEVLGFDDLSAVGPITLGDRTFPITHGAFGGAVPVLLTTHEYDLDRADPRFGEEGRRRAPHGLMQELLNASDDALWGIVANGTKLRLLRDNPSLTRPAYIEADLDLIFAEQLYPDFAALWLVAHASRLRPVDGKASNAILERWRAEAHETGERALDHLRDGVTEALKQLGNGFLQHPENETLRAALADGSVSAERYFQELLRLVYRLLFLFTAEERDLLHGPGATDEQRAIYAQGYGLARLRDRALKRRHYDRHHDLWQGLKIVFRALASGEPALALPALGGLFAPEQCPYLEGGFVSNERLLEAIRALAFFRTAAGLARVNYRDMDTEELGSVYESLLELHPVIDVDATPWTFGFVGEGNGEKTKGSERKLTGSYYTPAALVNELIKSALEPVMADAIRSHPRDPRPAILNLKIVDPACGSGHFLLAAARRLAAEIARIEAGSDTPDEAARQHALREVVQHCIYGVDRNPLAVELCRTALWIETIEPGKPLSFLDHHIQCGDSLVGILDPDIMGEGIPDEAYKPLTGDDKDVCKALKKRNREAENRARHGDLFVRETASRYRVSTISLDDMPEESLADIATKRERWQRLQQDPDFLREKHRADLFAAAFFAPKTRATAERVPVTEDLLSLAEGQTPRPGVIEYADELAAKHRFFHWHLAFPDIMRNGGFDVVLGNPPYLSAIDQKNAGLDREKQYWAAMFVSAKGAYDVYILFLELSGNLVRQSGRVSLLTPNKYLSAPYGAELRSQIADAGTLIGVVDVSRSGAFTDASVYPLISIFSGTRLEGGVPIVAKLPNEAQQAFEVFSHEREFIDALPDHNWGVLLSRGAPLVQRASSVTTTLGTVLDICASTTAAEADKFTELLRESDDLEGQHGWKVINTGLIDPFHSLWAKRDIRHGKVALRKPFLVHDDVIVSSRRASQYSRPKIIVAKLGKRIEALFDEDGRYAALNVNFIFANGDAGYFYLGQLNSIIMSWLYSQMFGALSMSGDYMQFQAPQLKAMLVVPFDAESFLHKQIAALARAASIRPHDNEVLSSIDLLVARILGLSADDVASIVANPQQAYPSESLEIELSELRDGAWARPRQDPRAETGAQLAAILKVMEDPLPARQVRLATLLALEPRLLPPYLDEEEAANWQRLIGPEADPLPPGTPNFVARADAAWGAAVRHLRTNGHLVEDIQAGTWAPGAGLDRFATDGWPDGRARMVLKVLQRQATDTVVAALPTELRDWVDAAAA